MESATILIDKRGLIGSNISVKNQSCQEDKSTERGLEVELSTKDEIIQKFYPLINSLEIHKGPKLMNISR